MAPRTARTSLGFTPALRISITADPDGRSRGSSVSTSCSAPSSASALSTLARTRIAALRRSPRTGLAVSMTGCSYEKGMSAAGVLFDRRHRALGLAGLHYKRVVQRVPRRGNVRRRRFAVVLASVIPHELARHSKHDVFFR